MPYQNILEEIVKHCKAIFASNLTGIYLHGSMVMGCFHPQKSDIDLIIVVDTDIPAEQKQAFMEVVVDLNRLATKKGLELSIVKKEYCEHFVYPTPFELHFSSAHLQWFQSNPTDYVQKMNGTDRDLSAHFTIIKKYGITLFGTEISALFADVPREDYLDSIRFDVENAKEEVLENPVYILLNLCRIIAFVKEDLILSKKEGGQWGLSKLPSKYHPLISSALENYTSEEETVIEINETDAMQFCEDMLTMINLR